MEQITLQPSKRRALSALRKADLAELVRVYGLSADKRSKDKMLAALEAAELSLAELVADMPAAQLAAICAALELSAEGGAEALRARILGQAAPGPQAALDFTAAPKEAPKLNEKVLGNHLWSAADILRGQIDSSDYKSYIFGLLFLKRLSDVFEEEADKLVAAGADRQQAYEDPDEHAFFVPKRARWEALCAIPQNIGEAINKACLEIEGANSSLEGVLRTDFNDEQRLGDSKNRDSVLSRLLQHFSKLGLKNSDLEDPDILGRAYEYLIERFADDAGKKGGEFYTPKEVVRLVVALLDPKAGMRISDPTCGSGGMLIRCAQYVREQAAKDKPKGGPKRLNLSLHGQEKNLGTWGICKMNMVLHGLVDHVIKKGDTIRDPQLREHGELILYDRVIANPPFSLDEWGIEVAESDPYGRFSYGVPPKTKGDLAFVSHMIATLKERGRMAVVMPHGVLFRGSREGKIRSAMLAEDLFEAVIGLPPQLFYGTGIPAAVLVMRRKKEEARRGKVLFIDASQEFGGGTQRNFLRDEDIGRAVSAFRAFADIDRYAKVVGLDEIRLNGGNLNISRYVDLAEEVEQIDVGAAVQRLRELEAERSRAEATMNAFLGELGYGA